MMMKKRAVFQFTTTAVERRRSYDVKIGKDEVIDLYAAQFNIAITALSNEAMYLGLSTLNYATVDSNLAVAPTTDNERGFLLREDLLYVTIFRWEALISQENDRREMVYFNKPITLVHSPTAIIWGIAASGNNLVGYSTIYYEKRKVSKEEKLQLMKWYSDGIPNRRTGVGAEYDT